MLDYSRVSVRIGNSQRFIANTVNISESASYTPGYILGGGQPIDISPNNISNNVSINYTIDSYSNSLVSIANWKDLVESSSSLLHTIYIGSGMVISGYMNSLSLSVNPNEPIAANATYVCFHNITGEILHQPYSNSSTYNLGHGSGIFHGWSVSFLKDGAEHSSGEFLGLEYNFDASISPVYGLGSSYPKQVDVLSATETIRIKTESLYHTSFSGKDLTQIFGNIDGIRMKNISSDWPGNNIYISNDIQLSGFRLHNTTIPLEPNNLIVFNNEYRKYL